MDNLTYINIRHSTGNKRITYLMEYSSSANAANTTNITNTTNPQIHKSTNTTKIITIPKIQITRTIKTTWKYKKQQK